MPCHFCHTYWKNFLCVPLLPISLLPFPFLAHSWALGSGAAPATVPATAPATVPATVPATAALSLGSATSRLSTKMCRCTSGPFDVISSVWWGPSLVVWSALTGTACTSHCRLAVNSFSFPLWGDFSLGYPDARELAFLQLSFFFNFSPCEVVLMKYKIFSQNKTSRKSKL